MFLVRPENVGVLRLVRAPGIEPGKLRPSTVGVCQFPPCPHCYWIPTSAGRGGGIRTRDFLDENQMPFQLGHTPIGCPFHKVMTRGRLGTRSSAPSQRLVDPPGVQPGYPACKAGASRHNALDPLTKKMTWLGPGKRFERKIFRAVHSPQSLG